MTSKGRHHDTGDVTFGTNAYGNRKVVRIHIRGKAKPHTVIAAGTPSKKRKGLTNTGGAYDKRRYVGRRTGRRA